MNDFEVNKTMSQIFRSFTFFESIQPISGSGGSTFSLA